MASIDNIDQFILVITDEAMDRVCYETSDGDAGWKLKPYQFAISDTDLLAGYTDDQIFNEDGSVKDEIYALLQRQTKTNMDADMNIWCELPFSGITKPENAQNTLSHHVIIPPDLPITGDSKQIKTIYYLYSDINGTPFLYAVARANTTIIYETGLTQKYFFNFTVANSKEQALTEFIVNYSYPLEIQDHNTSTSTDIHQTLLARDGSRLVDSKLYYSSLPDFYADPSAEMQAQGVTKQMALVDKDYVDRLSEQLEAAVQAAKAEMMSIASQASPSGLIAYWPGAANTVPSGWTVRDGKVISIANNPKLYGLIGGRYNNGSEAAGTFRIMNDLGLFLRGYADNLGVGLGQIQAENCTVSVPFHGWSCVYGHGIATHGRLIAASGLPEKAEFLESLGVTTANRVFGGVDVRPRNRNYLPIIKLG